MAIKFNFTVCVHFAASLCTDSGVHVCRGFNNQGMYDYVATINEEFDFKAEDIIMVMDMPLDGW